MEIYYENNAEQKIMFNNFPIVIQKPETLFDTSGHIHRKVGMDEIQSHPFIRILLKRALHFLFLQTQKKNTMK